MGASRPTGQIAEEANQEELVAHRTGRPVRLPRCRHAAQTLDSCGWHRGRQEPIDTQIVQKGPTRPTSFSGAYPDALPGLMVGDEDLACQSKCRVAEQPCRV